MRKWWLSIMAIFVAGSIIFSYGIIQAFQVTSPDKNHQGESNTSDAADQGEQVSETVSIKNFSETEGNVRIVVAGDSIARGTGDSTGAGITGDFRNFFAKKDREIEVINTAVDGFTTTELHEQMQKDEMQDILGSADMIILSIGGNDIREFVQNGEYVWEASMFAEGLSQYMLGLTDVLQTIREVNPTCLVFVIGLYNPIDEGLLSMFDISVSGTELLDAFFEWNYQTQKMVNADPYNLYVPTEDIFRWNVDAYISYDRVHPNSVGYQAISKRMIQYFELTYSD